MRKFYGVFQQGELLHLGENLQSAADVFNNHPGSTLESAADMDEMHMCFEAHGVGQAEDWSDEDEDEEDWEDEVQSLADEFGREIGSMVSYGMERLQTFGLSKEKLHSFCHQVQDRTADAVEDAAVLGYQGADALGDVCHWIGDYLKQLKK